MKTKSLFISLVSIALLTSNTMAQEESKWSNTPIEVKSIEASKAIVMKADVPMSSISEKMGEIYKTVFTYIQENSIIPAGPAFAVYYSFEPEGNIVIRTGGS